MNPFSEKSFEHAAMPLQRALADMGSRLRKRRHCACYLSIASHFLAQAERMFDAAGDPMDPHDAAIFQVLRDLNDALDRLRVALTTAGSINLEADDA